MTESTHLVVEPMGPFDPRRPMGEAGRKNLHAWVDQQQERKMTESKLQADNGLGNNSLALGHLRPGQPVTLVPNKPDAEVAEDFKKQIFETYKPILKLLDDIKTAGFEVQCATGPDAFGKQVITLLRLVKTF